MEPDGGGNGAPGATGPPPVKPFSNNNNVKRKLGLGGRNLMIELREECRREEREGGNGEGNGGGGRKNGYLPPDFVVDYLEKNFLRRLSKQSKKFPRANYRCRICDYHCDTLNICLNHIRENPRHLKLSKMAAIETTLLHLPKANRHHLEALDATLLRLEAIDGLSKDDVAFRKSVAEEISVLIESKFDKRLYLRAYGSSLSGFGFKKSGLNLDLQIQGDKGEGEGGGAIQPHVALSSVFDLLLAEGNVFKNIRQDFTAKIPLITFKFKGLQCEISLANGKAYQTSLLLGDYIELDPRVRTLGIAARLWARRCGFDDQTEGGIPPHSVVLLLIHYLLHQHSDNPVIPCIHDYLESRDVETYSRPEEKLRAWKSQNTMSVSELWIGMFQFYSKIFKVEDVVVSIRYEKGIPKDDTRWKSKRLSIEDPFSTKRNLCRSVRNWHMFDFIGTCFKFGYLYFGTIQTTQGSIITKICLPESPERRASDDDKLIDELDRLLNKLNQEKQNTVPSGSLTLEELERSFEYERITSFEAFLTTYGTELTPEQAQRVTDLVPKNMINFIFNPTLLTGGMELPPVVCTVCGREGHPQRNCPEERLPEMKTLPYMPKDYKAILSRICRSVMSEWEPRESELKERQQILDDLTDFIRRKVYPDAVLMVFGSSANGFAFAQSDLDLSLTFEGVETADDLDVTKIIENLAEKIQKMPGIREVQAITSAKVPILKFIYRKTEADICTYNVLAQENTRMLRLYSRIDPRVRMLGYMAKLFAKRCDIGDASRGSLSSYAYILLLIYYLQQIKPPVIPVLQEYYEGEKKPVNTVDGWNAWFCSNEEELKKKWRARNNIPVEELWLGFLQFYGHDFDDDNTVVCIRQLKPLMKFEKMWNSKCIAIEDPFDLSHNLGAGLSRRMNLFIKKTFIKSRLHFGTPPPRPFPNLIDYHYYLFDPRFLAPGNPPNDRGCRACGKIGHLVRDCPRKKEPGERRAARKQRKGAKNKTTSSPPPPPGKPPTTTTKQGRKTTRNRVESVNSDILDEDDDDDEDEDEFDDEDEDEEEEEESEPSDDEYLKQRIQEIERSKKPKQQQQQQNHETGKLSFKEETKTGGGEEEEEKKSEESSSENEASRRRQEEVHRKLSQKLERMQKRSDLDFEGFATKKLEEEEERIAELKGFRKFEDDDDKESPPSEDEYLRQRQKEFEARLLQKREQPIKLERRTKRKYWRRKNKKRSDEIDDHHKETKQPPPPPENKEERRPRNLFLFEKRIKRKEEKRRDEYARNLRLDTDLRRIAYYYSNEQYYDGDDDEKEKLKTKKKKKKKKRKPRHRNDPEKKDQYMKRKKEDKI